MSHPTQWPIVTLDGPAGVGKSTLARSVGDALGIPYLDTGAMFRSLALRLGEAPADLTDEAIRARCAATFSLEGVGARTLLRCDGVPVGDEIRTETVGMLAAKAAALPAVRDILKQAQRALGACTPLVAEGRDMGTVVFPEARHKFFLTADPAVRAQRRFLELQARGENPDLAALTEQIRARDALDSGRAIAPLRPADDAETIDTSHLDIEGVAQSVLGRIAARGGI